jgi:hypothetical protein
MKAFFLLSVLLLCGLVALALPTEQTPPKPEESVIAPIHPALMNNKRLAELIKSLGGDVEGNPGAWSFTVRGRKLYCFTDETHDRMRVVTAVAEVSKLDEKELKKCMEANFDRALDARYCVYKGALLAAFIHPLAELSESYFKSGVEQVVTLAETFGTTYNSGALIFGGSQEPEPSPRPKI